MLYINLCMYKYYVCINLNMQIYLYLHMHIWLDILVRHEFLFDAYELTKYPLMTLQGYTLRSGHLFLSK